ncbi:unnamed protein product, partial [Brassica rapa]
SPTDVLCVLNRQPTWAKITQTVHGKGQRAEPKDQHADMCTDGQPRTSSTHVLCMLTDTHGRPGQCAESKDQQADMCTDGQPRTSCVCRRTHTDSHGRPGCADGLQPMWAKITRTVHGKGHRDESKDQRADMCTDGQPQTSSKITQIVHRKGQRAEFKDQRADMCTDGQPRTSSTDVLCVPTDTHICSVCTEQTVHVGQNHPNSPREEPAG